MKLYTCKVVSLEDFIVIYIYIYSQVCLSICGNLGSTQNKPSLILSIPLIFKGDQRKHFEFVK